MNRIGLTFAALVVCTVFIIAGGLVGPHPALAADCPQPAMSGVSAAPTSLIGGNQDFNITLTFAGSIPSGCDNYYTCSSSNDQAVSAGICPANFTGNGTNQKTLTAISKVVDQTQNVTLTYQARTAQSGGTAIGFPVSTAVTSYADGAQ